MFKSTELLKDINKALSKWNERSSLTIKGIKGLSIADIDTLELYAELGGRGLMKPLGNIARVLEKYGYEHSQF